MTENNSHNPEGASPYKEVFEPDENSGIYEDDIIKPITSEADDERSFEGTMHTSILLGTDAYNDYFIILGYDNYNRYLGPGVSWVGDESYHHYISIIGDHIWEKAQEMNKNKFVFKLASEGYTFLELKLWSDVFEYVNHRYLVGPDQPNIITPNHFVMIWACAPHTKNYRYMIEHNKKYKLMLHMSQICSNGLEDTLNSQWNRASDSEKKMLKKLNSKPKIKPYKFLFYNNHPKINRVYFVGQIIRRNLHAKGLMSLNVPEKEFDGVVEQYADPNNSFTQAFFPETGPDVFQALVNNKELTLSLKGLGSRDFLGTNNFDLHNFHMDQDQWISLGEDTIEHASKCYFAIITETKYLQDITNKTHPEIYPHVSDTDYEFPITIDTNFIDCITFTEKTYKFILAKMPFVLCGMPGALAVLRETGYKTFSPWINEAYDLIENDEDRAVAIAEEIERLCSMTDEWWLEAQKELLPRLEHNFKYLVSSQQRCQQSFRFALGDSNEEI
jgi:hypothetical protein